jgi:hypothetical protein
MTIKLLARPLVQPWEETPDWTSLTLEGDSEDTIASIAVSHLLMTRHEVVVDEEEDPLQPEGDDNGEAC